MRWRTAAVAVLLAASTGFGAVGCTTAGDTSPQPVRQAAGEAIEALDALGAEGQVLGALGFDLEGTTVDEVVARATDPDRQAVERGDRWRERHQILAGLRRGMVHGEAVVRTKEGKTRTVAMQCGTVTAISTDSMTVQSIDGFTMTWRFGPNLRVVQRRTTVQADEVQVGTKLGVAGTKDGEQGVARLILIPLKKK